MTSAPAVSAALRRAGFAPVDSDRRREGIRVTRGWSRQDSITVCVDIDNERLALALAQAVDEALCAAGYTVKRTAHTMQVTR